MLLDRISNPFYFRLLYLPTHLRKPIPPRLGFERGSVGKNPTSNIMTTFSPLLLFLGGCRRTSEIGRSCAAGAGFRTRAGGRALPFRPVQPQLLTAVRIFENSGAAMVFKLVLIFQFGAHFGLPPRSPTTSSPFPSSFSSRSHIGSGEVLYLFMILKFSLLFSISSLLFFFLSPS